MSEENLSDQIIGDLLVQGAIANGLLTLLYGKNLISKDELTALIDSVEDVLAAFSNEGLSSQRLSFARQHTTLLRELVEIRDARDRKGEHSA